MMFVFLLLIANIYMAFMAVHQKNTETVRPPHNLSKKVWFAGIFTTICLLLIAIAILKSWDPSTHIDFFTSRESPIIAAGGILLELSWTIVWASILSVAALCMMMSINIINLIYCAICLRNHYIIGWGSIIFQGAAAMLYALPSIKMVINIFCS